jgi:diguanylate cyclase (GGDEF)-like protein
VGHCSGLAQSGHVDHGIILANPFKIGIFAAIRLVAYLPWSTGLGSLSRRAVTIGVAVMWGGGVLAAYLGGGRDLTQTLECAALMLGASALAAVSFERPVGGPVMMAPPFVATFCALLLLGPDAALLVAAIGAATPRWKPVDRRYSIAPIVGAASIAIVATEIAGLVYTSLGGAVAAFTSPVQAVPIAGAAIGYYLVESGLSNVVIPLIKTRSINRTWSKWAIPGCSTFLVGAGLAAAAAAAIEDGSWALLIVAILPVTLAFRAYAASVARLDEADRDRQLAAMRTEGVCVVDRDNRITFWDQSLERLLECPRERALGRTIADAIAASRKTDLSRTLKDALIDRTPRTISVRLAFATQTRVLSVRIRPIDGGLSLVWQDGTARTRVEDEHSATNDWLAVAAAAANDGLWEWNEQSREFSVTGRWYQMLGLPPRAGRASRQIWFDRVHPEDIASLRQALDAHLSDGSAIFQHEHRIRHEDGAYRRFLCRGVAVIGPGGRREGIAGSLTDTTEYTTTLERLRSVGVLDSLTGLWNREVFVETLGHRLEQGKVSRFLGTFAVLYIDIDRFKIVNDSLGHLVGDDLLIGISRRLESCLRQGDALARLGGDEFAILVNGLIEDGQAIGIALRIQKLLSEPFSIAGREVFTSASIGIAFGPAHYTNADDIMRDADTAMYHAKSRGKARHEVFDAVMDARVRDRLNLENDLRRAVANHEIEVHYQPIVELTSGMCIGFESLVRWHRADESVPPATFIPIAEELGLIEPLGTWVLQQACHTFVDWQRRFPHSDLECITVNVSSRQLMQHNFLRVVQQAVEASGMKRADLRLEITETALMDSPDEAAELLRELRKYGIKVYLDDFGTGYSSLSHLHTLPVDALKIDRSFVKSLLLHDRPAIVESILALARTLQTSVVAEGIETPEQARELERLGCTHAQGFLFSRAISAEAVEAMLMRNVPLGPKAERVSGLRRRA